MLSADNPHHWEFSTRKLADPKWQGQPGQRLTLDVQAEKPNELVIVLTENFFRSYRGKQQEFVAVVKLNGGKDTQPSRWNRRISRPAMARPCRRGRTSMS